jgi:hypothetical protein
VQIRVPLKHPLGEYSTATVRAGSPPSTILDVLGHRWGGEHGERRVDKVVKDDPDERLSIAGLTESEQLDLIKSFDTECQ